MITGFNTDVDYDGRVYHVQTEDKGLKNPVVESLVYTGGEILTSRRTSYEDRLAEPEFSEDVVLQRMESQHQELIRDIRNGAFDPDGPKPFGYNIVSNRSLDEVVVGFLGHEESELEQVRLEPADRAVLIAGSPASMGFRVLADGTDRAVAGAVVRVKLLSTSERSRVLFRGSTDENGNVTAKFDLPEIGVDAEAAVVIQVEAGGRNAEMKQLVRKADRRAGRESRSPGDSPPADEAV